MVEVVIAATRVGMEEQRLFEAARKRSGTARLSEPDQYVANECSTAGHGWPSGDLVVNRLLGYTQALALAQLIEAAGGRSVNSAEVIAACGSKVATTARLRLASVPMPPTRIAFSKDAALVAIDELGYPCVVKPIIGSWGRLLARINDVDAAEAVLSYQESLPSMNSSVYYLQLFVPPPSRDLRAIVSGDRLVCVVERRADHWIRNLSRHHRPYPVQPTEEITHCALAAAKAVGGGVVGVDLLEDDEGRVVVLEVNHRPEFRWTQEATDTDIAAAIIDWALEDGR